MERKIKQYSSRRNLIREVIRQYWLVHPQFRIKWMDHINTINKKQANEFAAVAKPNTFGEADWQNVDKRLLLSIPKDLLLVLNTALEQYDGIKFGHPRKIAKDKIDYSEVRWFAREFPEFCVPEKI